MPLLRAASPYRNGEAGFSLLELVVVVGTVAVIMAVLVLGIRQASGSVELRRAASTATSELRKAQAAAMAEGVDYTVEFYVTTGSAPGGLKVWRQGSTSPSRTVLPPEWPGSVQMQAAATNFPACNAPADPAHLCAVYKPLGYPVQGGTVRLGTSAGVTVDVVVEPATGRVSVQRQ